MTTPQQQATLQNLPHDVLTKILIRIHAKQLAQMRCVSKSCNSFLSQRSFIKSHLDQSIRNNDEILLVFYDAFSFDQYKPFTAHPSQTPHLQLTDFVKLPINSQSQLIFTRGSVIGFVSVNGLISFSSSESDHDSIVHIWNPSLSAMLTLPPYSIPYHGLSSIKFHLRYGFNPKTDDYKVVKLATLIKTPSEDQPRDPTGTFIDVVKEWLHVEVYSMRRGSWEIIAQKFPSCVIKIKDQDDVFVDGLDGYLHWLGYIDEKTRAQTIVAFDLDAETFHKMQIPDSIIEYSVYNRSNVLGVFAGKLCVMSTIRDVECEVWVMDRYGVSESWVKHHVFSQFGGRIIPYGFTSRGEFVFDVYEGYNRFLYLYDPVAATSKPFNVMSMRLGITKIGEYVDSLVWVTPTDSEISCCSFSRLQM